MQLPHWNIFLPSVFGFELLVLSHQREYRQNLNMFFNFQEKRPIYGDYRRLNVRTRFRLLRCLFIHSLNFFFSIPLFYTMDNLCNISLNSNSGTRNTAISTNQ